MRSGANSRHGTVITLGGAGADGITCSVLQHALLDLARAGLEIRTSEVHLCFARLGLRLPGFAGLGRCRLLSTLRPVLLHPLGRRLPRLVRHVAPPARGLRWLCRRSPRLSAKRRNRRIDFRDTVQQLGPLGLEQCYDILHRHSRFMSSPSTPQDGIAYRHSTPASAADHPGGPPPRQRPGPRRSPTPAAPRARSQSVTSTTSTPNVRLWIDSSRRRACWRQPPPRPIRHHSAIDPLSVHVTPTAACPCRRRADARARGFLRRGPQGKGGRIAAGPLFPTASSRLARHSYLRRRRRSAARALAAWPSGGPVRHGSRFSQRVQSSSSGETSSKQ